MDLLALYLKRENIIVDDETYVMLTNELSAILKRYCKMQYRTKMRFLC